MTDVDPAQAIIDATCSEMRICRGDLYGPDRGHDVVLAREIISHLAHEHVSYPTVAARLARRSHSTFWHAGARLKRKLKDECRLHSSARPITRLVEAIRRKAQRTQAGGAAR